MLPSIFEKHKICSNLTKSPLIVNSFNIISENSEGFAMEWRLLFNFTLLSAIFKLP